MSDESVPASGAYVGLALPGELGSWQNESKVQPHLIILYTHPI